MSEWVSISEICDVYDGPHATPPSSDNGPIYLGIKAINKECRIDETQYRHIADKDFHKWIKRVKPQAMDIVFSYEATLGRYAIIPDGFNGCLGRRLGLVRVKNHKQVNYKYLYYFFLSPYWTAFINRNILMGATVNRISVDDFPSYKVFLPSKFNQDKMVSILDVVDTKYTNNQKEIKLLENMAKTIYDYYFLQFDFPDAQGRPYRASGGKMVYNKELDREIPYDWKVDTMSAYIDNITNGLNPRKNFILNDGGEIDYLTVKNLNQDGSIDFSNCDKIDEKARKKVHKRSDISIGDILMASIAPLGRCHVITNPPETWDINESVFSIRPSADTCTSAYLYYLMVSEPFIKQIENNSAGSIFKGIRVDALNSMPIIIPPKGIIDIFTEKVSNIIKLKNDKFKESRQLMELRDFLLPLLMNGQVQFKG